MKFSAKNIIKSIAFLVIFSIGLIGLYSVLKWKDTNGDYLSTFESLYSLEKDEVDVVFVGPSFTYQTMNPAVFWQDYGISSFTMSVSGQGKDSAVAGIKEVLKTQTPKVVMVDASEALFDKYEVRGNLYRNTISMDLSVNNIELISDTVDPDERMDYVLRWPIVHTRYKELKKYDFVQNQASIATLGYRYVFDIIPRSGGVETNPTNEAVEISETNKVWVDELEQLAKENNFELVFYVTPGAIYGDYRLIINGFAAYLEQKSIAFIDMDKTELAAELDYSTDFTDYRHVSYFGSRKVMRYIAGYLAANYVLYDHRGEEGYSAWKVAVDYMEHCIADYEIINAQNVDSYDVNFVNSVFTIDSSDTIAKYTDGKDSLVVVIALEGDYMNASPDIKNLVMSLGLSEQEYQSKGTWIFDGNSEIGCLYDVGTFRLKINESENLIVERKISILEDYTTLVSIGDSVYRETIYNNSGAYVFIYDKTTETVVCNSYL